MRESIGSVSIFAIVITFIMLITAYLAISVNYAKAFRIKNHIINMIEENHGIDGDLQDKISLYLISQGYTASKRCPEATFDYNDYDMNSVGANWINGRVIHGTIGNVSSDKSNYCIYELTGNSSINDLGGTTKEGKIIDDIEKHRSYYKVVTFFKFDIPVIGNLATFNVSGDSELVYNRG